MSDAMLSQKHVRMILERYQSFNKVCTKYKFMNIVTPKYMAFIHSKEMLIDNFKKTFANYMRFRHPHVKHRWKQDYSTFKRLSYDVMYIHVCVYHGPSRMSTCENVDIHKKL